MAAPGLIKTLPSRSILSVRSVSLPNARAPRPITSATLLLPRNLDAAHGNRVGDEQRVALGLHPRTLLEQVAHVDQRQQARFRGDGNGDIGTDSPDAMFRHAGKLRHRQAEVVARHLPLRVARATETARPVG